MDEKNVGTRKGDLTTASFESLLQRLDPDRERAGGKYENIRRKLIKFFQWNDCFAEEDLADETLDRAPKSWEALRSVMWARFFGAWPRMLCGKLAEGRQHAISTTCRPPWSRIPETQSFPSLIRQRTNGVYSDCINVFRKARRRSENRIWI